MRRNAPRVSVLRIGPVEWDAAICGEEVQLSIYIAHN
jgi:hypothetical protein